MGNIKVGFLYAFTKYVRKTQGKAFNFCCADSCSQWSLEPFSDLPLFNSCSKWHKTCQLSVHLTVNVSLTFAPLNSVKKHSFMEQEQAMTSMPKSKIDLLVRFFAVCCFRSYLYVSLNKFTTVVYNPDLTEELNEDWNSVCLKIVVV